MHGYGYGYPARRMSRLAPPTSNLYLRLFADPSYFTLSSGKITTWQGTGSSGKAASQGTALLQPSPGTGINGRTTVSFSGSQYMTIPTVALGAFEIFVVTKISSINRLILEHSANATTGSGAYIYTGPTTATLVNRSGVQSSFDTPGAWVSDNAECLVRFGSTGTHSERILDRNGVAVTKAGGATYSGNPGTSVITDVLAIGARASGAFAVTGDIGEILIYNSAPDATRAAQVLAYSRQYWRNP